MASFKGPCALQAAARGQACVRTSSPLHLHGLSRRREAQHGTWKRIQPQRSLLQAVKAAGQPGGSSRSAATASPSTDGGSRLSNAVEALQSRLRKAVLAEQAEQRQQQTAAYSRASAQRLARDGLALLGLQAHPHDRLYADFVWAFSLPAPGNLPYHRFKRGDTVLLAPAAGRHRGPPPAEDEGQLEGTVLEVSRQKLLVTLAKPVAEALGAAPPGTLWRLDQGVSSTTTRRQLAALERLPHLADPANTGEAAVRALLLGGPSAEALAKRPTSWAQQADWRAAAGEQLQVQRGLNPSQLAAVATALTRTLTLWQGPPGTGKTRTLLALIEVLVRTAEASPRHRLRQGSLLAVADTNAAADNLLEGLLARGIRAVRVGQPAKVRPELRHACVDALAEASAQGQRAARLRAGADQLLQQIRQHQHQLARMQQGQPGQAEQRQSSPAQQRQIPEQLQLRQQRERGQQARAQEAGLSQSQQHEQALTEAIRRLQRQADELWRGADDIVAGEARRLLEGAPVVVATCNGAGEARLEGRLFRVIVLDEASQATEASSFVPLVKGAECVVMAGDQCQLPPTVLSREALQLGLDVPLFTRLLGSQVGSQLLEVQYRMHPAIAEFPSRQFYEGRVRSGVSEKERPPPQGVPWTNPSCPVLFVNVNGEERRSAAGKGGQQQQRGGGGGGGGSGTGSGSDTGGGGGAGAASYSNPAEADVVMRVLQRVLEQDDSLTSIALLSPYSGQVRLLSELLGGAPLPAGATQRCSLAVASVDGYQGREADLIIFSAVRCNTQGRVGFLSDQRRLNVAITRPRRGLIVVGHQPTLGHDPNWAAWMAWVAAQRKRRAVAPAEGDGVAASTQAPAASAQQRKAAAAADPAVAVVQGPGAERVPAVEAVQPTTAARANT